MKKIVVSLVLGFLCLAAAQYANNFVTDENFWITLFPGALYQSLSYPLYPSVAVNPRGEVFVAFSKDKEGHSSARYYSGYIQVVKIDRYGRIVGDKYIGTYRPDSFYKCMCPMGIATRGSTTIEVFTFLKQGTDGFGGIGVIKLDSNLRVLEVLPLMETKISSIYKNYIEPTPDGYIITSGRKERPYEPTELVVKRADLGGRTIWSHSYTDADWGIKAAYSPDNTIFVMAETETYDSLAVLKLDGRDGAPIWKINIPVRTSFRSLLRRIQLIPTPHGGLIIVNPYYPTNYKVSIYDSLGNMVKRQSFTDSIYIRYMMPLSDGTFLAVGRSSGDTATLAKIDTAGYWGRVLWLKKYRFLNVSRYTDAVFFHLLRAPDNGLIFGGQIDDPGYYFIMKTDSLGETGIYEQVSLFPQKRELTAHPNPFNKACKITLPDDDSWRVKVFDLSGRLVHDFGEISGKSVLWSPSDDVKSGIYVVVAEWKREQISGKVVYLK